MPELLNFRAGDVGINISREIAPQYFEFGVHLLQDDTGACIQALEKELSQRAEDITNHILQKWIRGQGIRPVSWTTLINTLRKSDMKELAEKIECHR